MMQVKDPRCIAGESHFGRVSAVAADGQNDCALGSSRIGQHFAGISRLSRHQQKRSSCGQEPRRRCSKIGLVQLHARITPLARRTFSVQVLYRHTHLAFDIHLLAPVLKTCAQQSAMVLSQHPIVCCVTVACTKRLITSSRNERP